MKKRLLVSTAMMLALTAIATSTSTYAWFTANKTATLAGPTLTAQSSAGIKVSIVAGGTVGDSKLTPISGDGKDFYVANSNTVGTNTYLTSITALSGTTAYWDVVVKVELDGASESDLNVKLDTASDNTFVTAVSGEDTADVAAANSVRVAVFKGEKVSATEIVASSAADFYWAPNEGDSNTQNYLKAASTNEENKKVGENVLLNGGTYPTGCVATQASLTQLAADSVLATVKTGTTTAYIGFRVWLEGMDTNCDNTAIDGNFKMNFSFTAQ